MFNKIYLKVKEFMKENYKFLLLMLAIYIVFTFPLPYYIYAGGGTINIDNRIDVEESNEESEGSLNFAYVRELKGNVASFILGNLIPSYDVVKEEESMLTEDEDEQDVFKRNQLYLENANQTAIMLAYNKALKKINIKDKHFYVILVEDKLADGLRVGDELLKINGQEITETTDYTDVVGNCEVGGEVTVTIERDGKEKEVTALVKEEDGRKVTGISIITIYDFETDPSIKLKFKSSEGGPSGGLMLTLAIYDKLTSGDLTGGLTIVGTGTIDSEGNVGEIGGVKYKLNGAVKAKADLFLVPAGDNYEEAMEEKEENNYDIEIKAISTFDEAVLYLESR